jgi:hypothetical protein
LLARTDCCEASCACMCALVQKTLAARTQQHSRMLCGQLSGSGQKPTCAMNTKHHPPDYGLNTMMAPTAPLPLAALAEPFGAAQAFLQARQFVPSGFLAAPFQPPRS